MKRVAALLGVFLLLSLYVTTLVCAIIGSEFALSMLKASICGTIFIPVILYAYLFLFKAFNKNSPIKIEEDTADNETDNKTDDATDDATKETDSAKN